MLVEQVLAVCTPIERDLLIGTAAGLSAKELGVRHGYAPRSVTQMISTARKKIREAFPDDTAGE
jgi:DNA-binding CsgD family transcriptional regulator